MGRDRSSVNSICGFVEAGFGSLWSEESVEVKGLSSDITLLIFQRLPLI